MRAVDTNILVRIVTGDNQKQVETAEDFISSGAWISYLVLAETAWVLRSTYALAAEQIAASVEMLLNHEQFVVQDADVVERALANFRKRPTLGFSDCLIVEIARKNGHLPIGTFDRELAKLDGAERLS
jgi:predicted nucleic-acid-binding protein